MASGLQACLELGNAPPNGFALGLAGVVDRVVAGRFAHAPIVSALGGPETAIVCGKMGPFAFSRAALAQAGPATDFAPKT